MSFPPATEMFQFAGFASAPYEFRCGYRSRGGLPHSEIPGSTIARISPGLFAACHVLHRLSVPRHPPNALKRLIRSSSAAHREQSPPHDDSKASTLTLSTHSITRLAVNHESLRPRAFAQGKATRANSQSHSYPQCQRAGIRDQASQPALFMFLGMAKSSDQKRWWSRPGSNR